MNAPAARTREPVMDRSSCAPSTRARDTERSESRSCDRAGDPTKEQLVSKFKSKTQLASYRDTRTHLCSQDDIGLATNINGALAGTRESGKQHLPYASVIADTDLIDDFFLCLRHLRHSRAHPSRACSHLSFRLERGEKASEGDRYTLWCVRRR